MLSISKTDKRQCHSKIRPIVTGCRGGVRLILTGKNTKGRQAQVTVFLDNAFLPGLVGDISQIVENKVHEAVELHSRIKNAANGKKPA